MDWEQLAIIAQIATGVATLALAAFLVRQIALQRQALELAHRDSERAHKDSERELLYTSNRLYTDIMGRIVDPEFGPIWRRGTLDYDSLAPDEQIQFQMWCQISQIAQATNFRTGHDGAEREGGASRIEVQNQVAWRQWPGVATYYERFGRQHTYDSDLRQLLDRVFLETQGREVETTWALGVNNRDS
ncbi:MAG: hypothetical protein CL778_02790 [Chloroflexi bacterium]|nr:hypothetical protein [Chloroflexota bacterium]MBK32268.1 hypothetical protein [Chloroflexota bacterium]|tara:strand:- start:1454 stop:2017 length:564 start_codon:yes stop_codon:yes gene_type:complete